MPPLHFSGLQNSIVIAQGKKGSGKTNAIKSETDDLSSVYFIDIRNEYNHVRKARTQQEFVRDLVAFQHGRISINKISRVSFSFSNRREYVELLKLMNGFQNTNIVIDEADTLFQDKKLEQPLVDLMLGARNNNVNLYYASKRPFLIPISVRSQADAFLVFRTKETRDVRYLEDKAPQGFPKDPRKLAQGQCLIIVDGEEEAIEVRQYQKYKEKQYVE